MSVDRPFLPAEVARAKVGADLDVIDAALTRLREKSTDVVGNAFRVEVTERLETQLRITGGLSYRMFAELADPPDGEDRPVTRPGVKLRDVLARRWPAHPRSRPPTGIRRGRAPRHRTGRRSRRPGRGHPRPHTGPSWPAPSRGPALWWRWPPRRG